VTQPRSRTPWELASDDDILDEVSAMAASGMTIAFGAGVMDLLRRRNLLSEVEKRLRGEQ
jgi:pyruvate formate-lyase activating enzyme-like uncharacterized protein